MLPHTTMKVSTSLIVRVAHNRRTRKDRLTKDIYNSSFLLCGGEMIKTINHSFLKRWAGGLTHIFMYLVMAILDFAGATPFSVVNFLTSKRWTSVMEVMSKSRLRSVTKTIIWYQTKWRPDGSPLPGSVIIFSLIFSDKQILPRDQTFTNTSSETSPPCNHPKRPQTKILLLSSTGRPAETVSNSSSLFKKKTCPTIMFVVLPLKSKARIRTVFVPEELKESPLFVSYKPRCDSRCAVSQRLGKTSLQLKTVASFCFSPTSAVCWSPGCDWQALRHWTPLVLGGNQSNPDPEGRVEPVWAPAVRAGRPSRYWERISAQWFGAWLRGPRAHTLLAVKPELCAWPDRSATENQSAEAQRLLSAPSISHPSANENSIWRNACRPSELCRGLLSATTTSNLSSKSVTASNELKTACCCC